MENVFDILNKGLPRPSGDRKPEAKPSMQPWMNAKTPAQMPVVTPAAPQRREIPTKDLVLEWQRKETPELTSELLKRMKPTMAAAMRSYAPNMEERMTVQTAKLTLEALRSYRPDFGTEPSTHVFNNLKRLGRIGARRGNIIPQPEAFMLEAKRAEDAKARFEDEKGREPSMQELADITGFSARKLDRLLNKGTVVSESSTLTEDNRHDTFASSDLTDDDYFEYVYASVGPIDQKVMEWSSGLHGKKVLSNNEIAARLKVSPAAVSQRRAKLQNMLSEVRALA